MVFYNWSGGMESSAMLAVDLERIRELQAIVRWVDTGKQFPEIYKSKSQIESILGIEIVTVPNRITFDEYLFEKGGMLRKGMNDCSRRMKRGNLSRHMKTFEPPYEINLGYNARESDRADAFTAVNERSWCHWRFPLIEAHFTREKSWEVCRKAGFSVVVDMYLKMGRMDCYFCPNQKFEQAMKVNDHYPNLAKEWIEAEEKKGHSFMSLPFKIMVENRNRNGIQLSFPETQCACFGGTDDVFAE